METLEPLEILEAVGTCWNLLRLLTTVKLWKRRELWEPGGKIRKESNFWGNRAKLEETFENFGNFWKLLKTSETLETLGTFRNFGNVGNFSKLLGNPSKLWETFGNFGSFGNFRNFWTFLDFGMKILETLEK